MFTDIYDISLSFSHFFAAQRYRSVFLSLYWHRFDFGVVSLGEIGYTGATADRYREFSRVQGVGRQR